jgi:hypothetical protein
MMILLEHFTGNFPLWLSPVQVKVLPVRESHNDYARKVFDDLKGAGIRAEFDDRDENLGKKVRETKNEKIPYWIVIGDKDIEAGNNLLIDTIHNPKEIISFRMAPFVYKGATTPTDRCGPDPPGYPPHPSDMTSDRADPRIQALASPFRGLPAAYSPSLLSYGYPVRKGAPQLRLPLRPPAQQVESEDRPVHLRCP